VATSAGDTNDPACAGSLGTPARHIKDGTQGRRLRIETVQAGKPCRGRRPGFGL